jgi:hypothetical protein
MSNFPTEPSNSGGVQLRYIRQVEVVRSFSSWLSPLAPSGSSSTYLRIGNQRFVGESAEVAGCKAIVLTVDVPLLGRRERNGRNRFKFPNDLSVKILCLQDCQSFLRHCGAGRAGARA